MQSHEIDYKIHGDDMQYVEITLDPGKSTLNYMLRNALERR